MDPPVFLSGFEVLRSCPVVFDIVSGPLGLFESLGRSASTSTHGHLSPPSQGNLPFARTSFLFPLVPPGPPSPEFPGRVSVGRDPTGGRGESD